MGATLAPTRPSRKPGPITEPTRERLAYLDNLKIVLVAAVIVMHAAVIYIPDSGFTYNEGSFSDVTAAAFTVVLVLGVLFAMPAFFLIAGFLTPGSLARKGRGRFLRDRLVRLGIPFAAFVLLLQPVVDYAVDVVNHVDYGEPLPAYVFRRVTTDPDTGMLWFVAVLLIFSTGYALWRSFRPRKAVGVGELHGRYLIALAAAIALFSFAVQLIWSLDSQQRVDLHLQQWPAYLLLFTLGVISAERGWLTSLPDPLLRRCRIVALATIACLLVADQVGTPENFMGGMHWEAALTAVGEGALAVSVSLWLLESFRRHHNRQGPRGRLLARCAYGAFVVQTLVLIPIGLALRPLTWPGEAKFLLLAPLGLAGSFGLAWLLTRLPFTSRVL